MSCNLQNIQKTYDVLRDEVIHFDNYIGSLAYTIPAINQEYRGCQILFSPLIIHPTLLFIGINPGAGYFNRYGHPVKKYDPQAMFEYIDANESYQLKNDTLNVFGKAGKTHLLNDAVKTNYMYFATSDMNSLFNLTTILCNHTGNQLPWDKANDWTNRLIKLIHPKFLICEGFKAFEYCCNALGVDHTKAALINGHIKYLKLGACPPGTPVCCEVCWKAGLEIIGYKRNSFGQMEDKDSLANYLGKTLPGKAGFCVQQGQD